MAKYALALGLALVGCGGMQADNAWGSRGWSSADHEGHYNNLSNQAKSAKTDARDLQKMLRSNAGTIHAKEIARQLTAAEERLVTAKRDKASFRKQNNMAKPKDRLALLRERAEELKKSKKGFVATLFASKNEKRKQQYLSAKLKRTELKKKEIEKAEAERRAKKAEAARLAANANARRRR